MRLQPASQDLIALLDAIVLRTLSRTFEKMRYKEIQPGKLLAPFIECFWTLEGEPDPSESTPERILPDGCVEIILSFADRFTEIDERSGEKLQPYHFLVGQMTRPVIIKPTGSVRLIGIRFHPERIGCPIFPIFETSLRFRIKTSSGKPQSGGRSVAHGVSRG